MKNRISKKNDLISGLIESDLGLLYFIQEKCI